MKIGILNFVAESTVDPAALGRKCEALGFESLFLAEHPIVPTHYTRADGSARVPDGKTPEVLCRISDLFVALSFAAASTTRLNLGTGICLVPERPPLLLAKEVATLDLYSRGRLIFGIGAGWLAEESEVMGVEFRRRWQVTREYVRAMKELWTAEESRFEGRWVKFPPVYCFPKPLQKPHPPILIGAGGMQNGFKPERALRDTVAIGDGWAPIGLNPDQLAQGLSTLKKLCEQAGRDFNKMDITLFSPAGLKEGRHTIEHYREAGATRLVLFPPPFAPDKAEAELEALAKAYIR
ncbi:MAG TPA: LLM class F420-dependent oxidoreductase [Candidatus Binataceae bacterium]